MIEMHRAGAPLKALAERWGKSPQTIRRLLDDAGEPRRPENGRRAAAAANLDQSYDSEQLRTWSAEGLTCAEMAQRLGRDEEAIRRAMVRRDIPRQPPKARPDRNVFWSGGYSVDKHGYILIRRPEHPQANHLGYVRQHRLVAEQMLGRRLGATEVVDHRNGDTSDNRIENLRMFPSNAEHLRVTLAGTRHLEPGERERLRLASVRRARARVAAILAGSRTDVGPSPSLVPRQQS